MDVVTFHDQAVETEAPPPRRKKHKDEAEFDRLRNSLAMGAALPKAEKKKSEGKKLKKKLVEFEEKNETLAKMIHDKNSEISELRISVNSLNEILNSVPIEELRCNSSIASSKLLDLSKKNRQLRAELELTKNRLSRKDLQLQKLEKDVKAAEEKNLRDGPKAGAAAAHPDDVQAKMHALQQKLFETRNKNVELTNQLKLAQKCLQQEIGENFNLNLLASHATSSNWRGRAQQILHLQQKVQELKDRLDNCERHHQTDATSYCSGDGDHLVTRAPNEKIPSNPSTLSMDRPNVRHSEIHHRSKVETLEKEIVSLKSQLEDSRNKILALKVRNKTLNDEVAKHKHKASNLEEHADFNSINVATINEKMQQQKAHYEKRMAELVKEMAELKQTYEEYNVKEEHMRSKVDELSSIIVGKDDDIAELTATLKKMERDLKSVCGDFLFSCREFRKEEFITILDCLETEKNSLMEHNKSLNDRVESERTKNEQLQEQVGKQRVRIARLEAKVREMERELDINNEKKKRTQRITEYATNLSAMGSSTSLMSLTIENSALIAGAARHLDDPVDPQSLTDLKNRLELANEKITMLTEKLKYVLAEKESDIKTFEHIINNSKNFIIESILAQRESLSVAEVS